jgi:hypothetical protein
MDFEPRTLSPLPIEGSGPAACPVETRYSMIITSKKESALKRRMDSGKESLLLRSSQLKETTSFRVFKQAHSDPKRTHSFCFVLPTKTQPTVPVALHYKHIDLRR